MMFLSFLFGALCLLSLVSITYWTVRNGISPMPTSPKVLSCLIQNLPKNAFEIIYELGSGWGTLAYVLAKKYPNSTIIGYETSLLPYLCSYLLKHLTGTQNLLFKRKNFFNISLSHADLIVCYLYPKAMLKLKDKFEQELHPGTVILTHTFSIPGWKPENTYPVHDLYNTNIYIYKI